MIRWKNYENFILGYGKFATYERRATRNLNLIVLLISFFGGLYNFFTSFLGKL